MPEKELMKKIIIESIQAGLKKQNISQSEFAKKLGVTRSVVGHWMKGRNVPPGDKLIEIIGLLDISEYIFGKNLQMYKNKDIEDTIAIIKETIQKYESKVAK